QGADVQLLSDVNLLRLERGLQRGSVAEHAQLDGLRGGRGNPKSVVRGEGRRGARGELGDLEGTGSDWVVREGVGPDLLPHRLRDDEDLCYGVEQRRHRLGS